jgi:phytoene synthase
VVDAAYLSALVRRVDEDRWLAARFAPRPPRDRLMAIYAVNYEIAKTVETVREPRLGMIRLAWWREAISEIAEGKGAPAHPAAEALESALPLPLGEFQTIIEARERDLDATPFAGWAELQTYVDATAGAVFRLGLAASGAAPVTDDFVVPAGRAWGFAGLLRAREVWAGRGRSPLPADARGEGLSDLAERARTAYAEARHGAGRLRAVSFPAYGYLALVPSYLQSAKSPALLARQFVLLKASLTGAI